MILIYLVLLAMAIIYASLKMNYSTMDDNELRTYVVMLLGKDVECTGFKVHAASNKTYILTAAHCVPTIQNDEVTAIDEDGSRHQVKYLDIDMVNDIMLLSSYDNKGLILSKNITPHESIKALGHGKGYPTYRREGEIITKELVSIPEGMVSSDKEAEDCLKWPNREVEDMFIKMCIWKLQTTITTMVVEPGMSGGPVFNKNNEVIGIVSNTNGTFSGIVDLAPIKDILNRR